MDILLGAALGTLIAFLLAIPAIILETSRRVQNLPLLIEVHVWRNVKLSHEEAFAFGVLLHLTIGLLYGALYVLFAQQGWLFITNAPFTIYSMLVFALCCWIVLNTVLFPLFGFGFLGGKEGKFVWAETLMSLMLEGAVLWVLIQYFSPSFFM